MDEEYKEEVRKILEKEIRKKEELDGGKVKPPKEKGKGGKKSSKVKP